MRLPALFVAFLLFCVAAFSAGCTGPSPGTNATTPSPVVTAPTAPPYTDLSELALTRADMPFTVVQEQNKTLTTEQGDPSKDIPIIRGYQAGYSSEETDSPTATILLQTIAEYPCGNVSSAFTAMEQNLRAMKDPRTTVIWFPDPGVGNRSFALTSKPASASSVDNPFTMIFFEKADVLEVIMLKTKTADIATLTGLARKAAAKIPPPKPGSVCPVITAAPVLPPQTTTEPTKIPVQPAVSALQVSGPVKVTSYDGKTVGKISFGLKSGSGSVPIDLARVQYMVSIPADLRVAGPGSPAVRYTGKTPSGTPDTILGADETVTVELDTGAMGFAAHPIMANNRITIEVRPPIGASLITARNVPPALRAGSSSECY